MTTVKQFLMNIIKFAMLGEKIETIDNVCCDPSFFALVSKHRISTMFYYGLQNSGGITDEIKNMFYETVLTEFVVSEKQMMTFAEIAKLFQDNEIDYMPLKGCLLKSLYPKPEIRRMGDIDILINMKQNKKISRIMKKMALFVVVNRIMN